MGTHTFNVSYLIRKCKADKTRADIYGRITIDGDEKEFSAKEQIDTKSWNSQKSCVKGNSIEVKSINEHLDNIKATVKAKYRELTDAGKLVTADTVRNAYWGIQAKLKGHTLKELTKYYKKIWEVVLKNGGFKNYKTTITYLHLFLEKNFNSGDVYLSQIDGTFATDFEHYIRTNPIKENDPCKGNGVGKHLQRFKRMLNWADETLHWIDRNPIDKYSCPIKKTKVKKLSLQQLFAIERKNFTNPELTYTKELFLYSCYAGLAFVDVMALSMEHFEVDPEGTIWCNIYRTKSDELCAIPLLKPAAKILTKYIEDAKLNQRKTIFPKITNQFVNYNLKIIQEACEIPFTLTFHVARHTFAKTVALKNGIPLETVQMMMGHSKITTTQIYAEVDEEKIMEDMAGLYEKIEIKKSMFNSKKVPTFKDGGVQR